jgi:DNA invertase Pin-like site-specific DNA recombinase
MEKFIAYIRRSKKEQDSTLGLEAQRREIDRHIEGVNGQLVNVYTEIESGTNKKLDKRTVILEAIQQCSEINATLIIAKLDRLARDVEFTSRLMNSGVKFVACDIPGANQFTIHVMAALAEQEAKRISERTKAALAEIKQKGGVLGWRTHKVKNRNPFDDDSREKSIEAIKKKAMSNPNNMRARNYAKSLKEQGYTLQRIADELNNQGFRSPENKLINITTVTRWIKWVEENDVTLGQQNA